MALFSMLRRPSYSALALAFRAVGSASTFHRAISTVPTFSPDLSRRSSVPSRRFSTAVATEQIGPESLIEILESEINFSQEKKVKTPVVPDEFPFEIVDNPGENTILLKREFEGETIQVGAHIPHEIPRDYENDNTYDSDSELSDDDPGVPLVVSISKKYGLQLEFGVTAFENELSIDSLSIKHPEHSPEKIVYDGPEFYDLDEGLQNALYKYLEVRGIKFDITLFLYDYMRKKDRNEHLMWLKNLKGFVEK